MKTVKDLIEVLQSYPPETRLAHFDEENDENEDTLALYFTEFDDGPCLYTEYDSIGPAESVAERWAAIHNEQPVYAFEIGDHVRWWHWGGVTNALKVEGTGVVVGRRNEWGDLYSHNRYTVKNDDGAAFPFVCRGEQSIADKTVCDDFTEKQLTKLENEA